LIIAGTAEMVVCSERVRGGQLVRLKHPEEDVEHQEIV
jgi:hypothetical protein